MAVQELISLVVFSVFLPLLLCVVAGRLVIFDEKFSERCGEGSRSALCTMYVTHRQDERNWMGQTGAKGCACNR
jgi:hypothetical protein